MKNYPFLVILLLSITIISCKKTPKFESYFEAEKYSKVNIKDQVEIQIDTIVLETIESSYLGAIEYSDESIVFVDFRFCWAFRFNLNGKFIERRLGQGRGPGELNMAAIDAFCRMNNGNYIFFGSTNNYSIHDKNWERLKIGNIDWKGRVKVGSGQEVKNPSANEPSIYGFDFQNLKIKNIGNSVYIPIYSEHPKFNGFIGFDYYRNGNIIAELNTETFEIDRIFGRRTPELLKYKYLMHHSTINFDIDSKNDFYIAHEIDSLIYVYDNDFHIKYAFGVAGKNMDTDYQELGHLDIKQFQNLYFNDRPKRGYYTGIKICEDGNLVFRSYQKGHSYPKDGLQIYENRVLIKDIEIPKGIEIKKCSPPYFYSNALIDEDNEKIMILRFKISNI